jgi:predicted NBD/HSP70 family sugar kinase
VLIEERQRRILHALLNTGTLSRSELHTATGIRKNTICDDTALLIKQGILRERDALRSLRGRPRTPLEIDPGKRHVVGLSIRPGHVEVSTLNLLGQPLDEPERKSVRQGGALIRTAADLLRARLTEQTFSVGIGAPGLIDQPRRQLLLSSVAPESRSVSLEPLFEAASGVPVVLENDMHATAAGWLLTHRRDPMRDTLLVYMDDGQLGASLLIAGRPNRGAVHGANELGHTRVGADTDVCYCGQPGCLERVLSTAYLRKLTATEMSLSQAAVAMGDAGSAGGTEKAMRSIVSLVGMGLANAVNFTRVAQLVLLGPLLKNEAFAQALIASTRSQTLAVLSTHVQMGVGDDSLVRTAQNAGWLALANLYYEGWDQVPQDASSTTTTRSAADDEPRA